MLSVRAAQENLSSLCIQMISANFGDVYAYRVVELYCRIVSCISLSSLWEHWSFLLKYNALLNQVTYLWEVKMSIMVMRMWNVIILLARIQETVLIEASLNLIVVLIRSAQAPEDSLQARRIWVFRAGNQTLLTNHQYWTLMESTVFFGSTVHQALPRWSFPGKQPSKVCRFCMHV